MKKIASNVVRNHINQGYTRNTTLDSLRVIAAIPIVKVQNTQMITIAAGTFIILIINY